MRGPRIVKTALLTGALAAGCMAVSPVALYANQGASASQSGEAAIETDQAGSPEGKDPSAPTEQVPETDKAPVENEGPGVPAKPAIPVEPAAPAIPAAPVESVTPANPSASSTQSANGAVQDAASSASRTGDPVPGAAMLRTAMNVKPAAGDLDEVLGLFKELFPDANLRALIRGNTGWHDDKQLTRRDLAGQPLIFFQDADFVINTKEAESLAHFTGFSMDISIMGKYSNPLTDQSWRINDMDAFWKAVAKWDKIPSFSMHYPEWKNGANQTLSLKFPYLPKVTAIQLSGWSRSSSLANPITKVFNGSDIKPENLPALTYLRWEDVSLDDWSSLGGLTGLTKLEIMSGNMKDASFISKLTGLTSVNLSGNALLDFRPLKALIDGGKLTSLGLSGQDRYMAGEEGFTMWGDMDEISIPLSVIAPDGTKMGADKFTGTKVEGGRLVSLPKGQLPEGIRYDEATHSFVLTREAAKALPRVKPSCLGFEANMFIVQFSCPIPGFTDASGKAWIEVNVTDAVQAKPINQVPVINAADVTITEGEVFDPMAGVTATDNEDGTVEVKVESSDVDATKPGTYSVTYVASDSMGATVRKTIAVTVKAAPKPEEKPESKPESKPEQTPAEKPVKKPAKKPMLPSTGDVSSVLIASAGATGFASIVASVFTRRRK